jgi:hypothetical protein
MKMSIELVQTRISPDILDTMGRSFRFRHANGVAEWLKNALDQYLRLRQLGREPLDGAWPVLLLLSDAARAAQGPNLAVVDFGGSRLKDIEDFFLYWGSQSAASMGNRVDPRTVTGGHGNGGKFYMREMWRSGARFLTFLDGKATSLVVEKRDDGNTGYWEFKDHACGWRSALDLALPAKEHFSLGAALASSLSESHPSVFEALETGTRGLTVVAGRRAEQLWTSNDVVQGGKWNHQRLIDAIRDASQARRPIQELSISVYVNRNLAIERLSPEAIEDDPDWPVNVQPLPSSLLSNTGMVIQGDTAGSLHIHKAAAPLTGRRKDRNSLSVLDGRGNPIASYPVKELPLPGHSPALDFIYGDLVLMFDKVTDLVQNDRERLVPGGSTDAILEWASSSLWTLVEDIDRAARESSKRDDLELASVLNDQLNQHARRFLEQLQTEISVDLVEDPEGGGSGPRGGEGEGRGGTGTGGKGQGGALEVPGEAEKVRRPRFPEVLLSGFDPDPSTGGTDTKNLTDRHPPLDQDDQDRIYNVWWINTEHVFAKFALERGGSKGLAFKNHQLHLFREVVQREALRYRQRREAELPLDRVENELSEVANRFLAELPYDLMADILGN